MARTAERLSIDRRKRVGAVNDWFFMLGESLSDSERRGAQVYLHGLGINEPIAVVGVTDWESARRAISDPAWDSRWWEAEQAEKRRLIGNASRTIAQDILLARLSHAVEGVTEAVHGAAAVAAARRGCVDAGMIRSAAGAASEALYLAELARLAGEDDAHPFAMKQSLFAGGHWPLGIVDGRYEIF